MKDSIVSNVNVNISTFNVKYLQTGSKYQRTWTNMTDLEYLDANQ